MNPAPPESPPVLALCLADESATDRLAGALATALLSASGAPGWVGGRIHLRGELGAGKTRLARGLLRWLGHAGRVPSPTFTLMESYNLPKFNLYHFDFYRLSAETDWLDAGFGDLLDSPGSVALIEWPELAGPRLGTPDLEIALGFNNEESADHARSATIKAGTPAGASWLNAIDAAMRPTATRDRRGGASPSRRSPAD